jgi:repressor LexA
MRTQTQKDLLIFIHERFAKGEVAPSFDEMKNALGLKSKSGIHRLISALVERGFLERLPNKARALEVRRLPEGYIPADHDQTEAAQKARMLHQHTSESHVFDVSMIASIPLCGKIAAGSPIEALEARDQLIDVPASMVGKGEHYALTIEGDSMVDAGIQDQDIVVIKKTQQANNGDIVVALVDGQEATLKRLRKRGSHIDLIPENRTHEIRTYESDRVAVQGKLSGLFRQYF